MKITIYKPEGKEMHIPMPLSMLKSASFWKLLGLDKEIDLNANKDLLVKITDILDQYRKKNGSFTLIEMKNENGEGINITI